MVDRELAGGQPQDRQPGSAAEKGKKTMTDLHPLSSDRTNLIQQLR